MTAHLLLFVESHDLGEVLTTDPGVYTRRDPDTVRAPDVAFISHDRLAGCKEDGYLDVVPEIVVEVLSPTDRKDQVAKKIEEYFSANVLRVWVLDSKKRRLLAYRSLTDVQEFGIGDVLADEELLPGFRLSLAELFRSSPDMRE